ncbi:FCD domain-containing protein [Saccharopolyspora shandongensis]|uniref:FCD domain-containing protein n=1 Tax=Saccharopolyspora shandongensis TaxID=418495 RepID=UPI00343332CB
MVDLLGGPAAAAAVRFARGKLARRDIAFKREHLSEGKLFEVCEALEVYAARLAAERAEPADVAQLAELARRAREAHEAGDVDTMSSSNASFHDKLVSLAGNDLMASILEPLHGRLAWLFRMNLEPERVCTEHEELQSAIAAGDADRAAAVAQQHVLSSRGDGPGADALLTRGNPAHRIHDDRQRRRHGAQRPLNLRPVLP